MQMHRGFPCGGPDALGVSLRHDLQANAAFPYPQNPFRTFIGRWEQGTPVSYRGKLRTLFVSPSTAVPLSA